MEYFNPIFLALAIGVLCAVGWFARRPMTNRARRHAPGQFAQLSAGKIHFQWHGPKSGNVIVLLHGLTTPSFVWRNLIPYLTEAGFRVLSFDHFGRGFSDRPRAKYDHDFYLNEIDELLSSLSIKKPAHLLGYSMGGGIAAYYAAQRFDTIDKVVLLAPVGFKQDLGGFFRFAANWSVIGDIANYLIGGMKIRQGAKASLRLENMDPKLVTLQCRETRYSGFTNAVLSSTRHVVNADISDSHEMLASRKKPLLARASSERCSVNPLHP